MSNSLSKGFDIDNAIKNKKSKCREGKKHKFIRYGLYPSIWDECSICGLCLYW